MKKLIVLSMTLFLLISSTQVTRADDPTKTTRVENVLTPPADRSAEVKQLLKRLNEIKETDRSRLSPSDKKQLRSEVKDIRKQLREISGGVYLSVGAIIIIILLLILIL